MSEKHTTEQEKEKTPVFKPWDQMMSYEEMLENVKKGAPLPRNLQRARLTAETLPSTVEEFYRELDRRTKNGPPYCPGTYCGVAEKCTGMTRFNPQGPRPCGHCQEASIRYMMEGSYPGTVRPSMKG